MKILPYKNSMDIEFKQPFFKNNSKKKNLLEHIQKVSMSTISWFVTIYIDSYYCGCFTIDKLTSNNC